MTEIAKPTVEVITAAERPRTDLAQFESLMLLVNEIPEVTAEEAVMDIVRQIINADTPEDVNAIWEAQGLLDYLDRPLLIRSIRRIPSRFKGIGVFFILDCHDQRTDKDLKLTSGATNVVGALIKAYVSDWFPVLMSFRYPKNRSEDGNDPVLPRFEAVRVGRSQ